MFNSENIISTTVQKTVDVIANNDLSAEIILINDGSTDDSWGVIKKIAASNDIVKSINLLKNYGQHNAIICGFANSIGDYVVTLDDDLQNPPEEIVKLINRSKEGDFDLVFGSFAQKKHSLYRRLGSKVVSYLNGKIFNKPKNIAITNFRIIRRDLIERVLEHKTAYPYVPGMLLKYSYSMTNTEVLHVARQDGVSNYGFGKILNLIGRLLINYSSYPLRLVSGIGMVVSLISFLTGIVYLFNGVMHGSSVPGWTTLVVLVSFLGGFIIVLLALIGEYLSRILNQMSGEKMFYVKEIVE